MERKEGAGCMLDRGKEWMVEGAQDGQTDGCMEGMYYTE